MIKWVIVYMKGYKWEGGRCLLSGVGVFGYIILGRGQVFIEWGLLFILSWGGGRCLSTRMFGIEWSSVFTYIATKRSVRVGADVHSSLHVQ